MPSKEENARNGLPETDWRDAQYDMLYLPVQKPSATTTISTATVPLPSCPTADRSTTCTTVAGTYTKSASTTKSLPKSNAHRVNSPAVTNSIPSSPKNEEVSDGLEEETGFVWVGRYIYIYTDPDNYELLAQVRDWTTEDEKGVQQATTSTAIKSAFRVR